MRTLGLHTRCLQLNVATSAVSGYFWWMDTESLRIMKTRRAELGGMIESLTSQIAPLQLEAKQLDAGIRAMEGVIPAKGLEATRNALAHHAKLAHPDVQNLPLKQLVIRALQEHLVHGASTSEMLEFFTRHWGRTDVVQTTLSPQLSRLKADDIIMLRGKVWHLTRNEKGEAEASPHAGGAATPLNETQRPEYDL